MHVLGGGNTHTPPPPTHTHTHTHTPTHTHPTHITPPPPPTPISKPPPHTYIHSLLHIGTKGIVPDGAAQHVDHLREGRRGTKPCWNSGCTATPRTLHTVVPTKQHTSPPAPLPSTHPPSRHPRTPWGEPKQRCAHSYNHTR
jgi:hypothetical protein